VLGKRREKKGNPYFPPKSLRKPQTTPEGEGTTWKGIEGEKVLRRPREKKGIKYCFAGGFSP